MLKQKLLRFNVNFNVLRVAIFKGNPQVLQLSWVLLSYWECGKGYCKKENELNFSESFVNQRSLSQVFVS